MVLRALAVPVLVASLLALTGCADTHAVAELAKAAASTAREGPPVFDDLADACDARYRWNANVRAAWEKPATPDSEQSTCARFRSEGGALDSDSEALAQYFEAIQRLASAGSATGSQGAGGGSKGGKGGAAGSKGETRTGKELKAASDLAKLAGQLA